PRKVAPRRTAKDDEQRARASLEAAAAQSSAAASEQANAAAPPQPMRLPQTSATTERAMTDRAMFVGAPLMARTVAVPSVIVSPDANVRWRIVAGGNVERTTNGGISWETQSTGTSSTLTAGAAPSATVCWLVGPGGIVVLSTDGVTWHRVPFPEAIDLRSIRAVDDTSATVTTADGRTLTTTDRGKTWRVV